MRTPAKTVYRHAWHAMSWGALVSCIVFSGGYFIQENQQKTLLLYAVPIASVFFVALLFRRLSQTPLVKNGTKPIVTRLLSFLTAWWFYFGFGCTVGAAIFSLAVWLTAYFYTGELTGQASLMLGFLDITYPIIAFFQLSLANFLYKRALKQRR